MSLSATECCRNRRCTAGSQPWLVVLVCTLVLLEQAAAPRAGQGDVPAAASAEVGAPAAEAAQGSGVAEPPFEFRGLYAPGHFGNSYEVMGENEMRQMLGEARSWGLDRYGDWFDMLDCSDPFAQTRLVTLAHALWDAKQANYRSAGRLGLPCDLVLTPNHVYVDQCLAHLAAKTGGRVFGQLICPSVPEAQAIILRDYEQLFADLARHGVQLAGLCPCPYDYGGCNCPQCQPWILTWAKLTHEICEIARKHHPRVETHMIGWWWEPEEHKRFADWADREAPEWVKTMYLHIPYDKTRVGDVALPHGCVRGAFVHIGYCDKKSPPDIYGMLGPVIAPNRLPKTLVELRGQGVTRLMAYSEGLHDDVNKALYGGLSSGRYRTANEVLRAYAKRYYGVDDQTAAGWARWLAAWGAPFDVDTAEARRQLDVLLANTPNKESWRVQQWVLKLELFRLHGEIAKGESWTPERLALVEQLWAVREQIHRGLWGLAPQRHGFHRRYCGLPWYRSWAEHASQSASELGREQ